MPLVVPLKGFHCLWDIQSSVDNYSCHSVKSRTIVHKTKWLELPFPYLSNVCVGITKAARWRWIWAPLKKITSYLDLQKNETPGLWLNGKLAKSSQWFLGLWKWVKALPPSAGVTWGSKTWVLKPEGPVLWEMITTWSTGIQRAISAFNWRFHPLVLPCWKAYPPLWPGTAFCCTGLAAWFLVQSVCTHVSLLLWFMTWFSQLQRKV